MDPRPTRFHLQTKLWRRKGHCGTTNKWWSLKKKRISSWIWHCRGSVDGEGNGNPLQYSCLENPMDRGAWWATVYGVAKSLTRLSNTHSHTHTHTHRSLKSRCQQGHATSATCKGESSPDSPWFLVFMGDPWHFLACRHISPISASVVTWPSSPHVSLFFL